MAARYEQMPASPLNVALQHFLAARGPHGGGMTDGELLARFLNGRDEDALAALVRRHAPMVWGVCGRLLPNHHDAEDAFQATFLVLVRKAADVPRHAVANWLYGVARQTAVRLRATATKRGRRETQVVNMPEPTAAEVRDADFQAVLDEELSRLPEHYRGVLVLCDLEGMTRKEAARQLAIPEGSVASRLARARAMLAKRLTRRGVVFSGGSVAVLSAGSASASALPALVASTIKAASLSAARTAVATAVVSARVAALTEGVVRAMFLAKLKTGTCVLALTVLVGLGGVALVPGGGHLPTVAAAPALHKVGGAKPKPEARKLVRQLGSRSFAKRQAADKALASMGARAAAAVRAGMGHADLEIARRCADIWPRLWQTEIARPDADRLGGYTHPLWARFRKAAGDDAGSRTLFAEMVADVKRFNRLEAVEADPAKAGAAYAAELKVRVEAIKPDPWEAAAAARGRLIILWPKVGIPTRGEFAALLFLGTYPSTAAVTYPEGGAGDRFSPHNVFGHHAVFELGLWPSPSRPAGCPPAVRRLFVAWLGTRTDPNPITFGMYLAVYNHIAEVVPLARRKAADAKLAPPARGLALLAVGRFGTPADLPVLEKAFADSRVVYSDKSLSGPDYFEVRMSDVAVAAALRLAGQHPADFGFPFLQKYKVRGPDTLARYYFLGFSDDGARQAAHKKAREWLARHGKEKRRQVKE